MAIFARPAFSRISRSTFRSRLYLVCLLSLHFFSHWSSAWERGCSIKVKVLRLWKVPAFLNPNEFSSIEMVLMDEKRATLLLGSNHISSW
ncbi:hypothetical protein TSUD_21140 [Trifolium subterraneum]|uniref:Uncharacterized protein n=1 Tax=Trifolium subterraneum TaxID=3900 RepID=A0A2Z6MPV1_TRISU|nr:hypothetical protein TSUD_21140 [Trifolium subterraneum]